MSKNLYNVDAIKSAVLRSVNYTELLYNLDISYNTYNLREIRKVIMCNNIDISHFVLRPKYKEYVNLNGDIFNDVAYRRISGRRLKREMLKIGVAYTCNGCGIKDWNGGDISLEVDHIDGNALNNSIGNLRFLCPNCHSQTSSYKAKNKGKTKYLENFIDSDDYKIPEPVFNEKKMERQIIIKTNFSLEIPMKSVVLGKRRCKFCFADISDNKHGACMNCYLEHIKSSKIMPPMNVIVNDIHEMGYVRTGLKYGVSDNAVRRWVVKYNLDPKSVFKIKP